MSDIEKNKPAQIKHFRQILLWPLQLMPFQKLYKNSFNHLIFKINIITGEPGGYRLALFAFMFALATALTLYTINKSKALSDFLEMMADERQSLGRKLVALVKAWWLRGKSSRS